MKLMPRVNGIDISFVLYLDMWKAEKVIKYTH